MIALDLGNKTGVAWHNGIMEYAEEIKLPVGKMPMMERACLLLGEIYKIVPLDVLSVPKVEENPEDFEDRHREPCRILIEDINIFRGKANMQGLIKLCGFVAGYFKGQGHHVELVHPRTWMGKKKRTVKSNKADALGLLQWGLSVINK